MRKNKNVHDTVTNQVCAGLKAVALSAALTMALLPVRSAVAAGSDQDTVTAVEVEGKKIPEGPHCTYARVATLPIQSFAGLLGFKVDLDGSSTNMQIDSGALHTTVTSKVAEKIGLQLAHSKLLDADADGNPRATYSTVVDNIALDRVVWRHSRLKVRQDLGGPFDAQAGADILLNGYNMDLEFSLATDELKFFEPHNCSNAFLAYWDGNAAQVPIGNLAPNDPRQVMNVKINGKTFVAMIDSGVPNSVINLDAAAKLGITPNSPGVTESNIDIGINKHYGKVWRASFNSFSIGGETIKNPQIAIADLWGELPGEPAFRNVIRVMQLCQTVECQIQSMQSRGMTTGSEAIVMPDILLGADFLRSHRVLLAMSQRQLYFTYNGGKVFGS